MKKITELETWLFERQLSTVTGGYNCSCGCQGTSSTGPIKQQTLNGAFKVPDIKYATLS